MKALILAGGQGTRLRPLTRYTPKPVVPLVNRPFALYQIELLRRCGITDITFSVNYQPDKIADALGDGSPHGVNINYIEEPQPMGTGGAYRYAMDGCREPVIVLNGDILTDVDLASLIAYHNENSSVATISLVRVADPSRYGVVELAANGSVRRFIEKPKGKIEQDTINAGIYILEPSVLTSIPANTNQSFEYDVFPKLLENGAPFFGRVLGSAYWRDIGTLESYLAAHTDLLAGKVGGFRVGDPTPTPGIDELSVIGENCTIRPDVQIVNSVIGPNVLIEENATIRNSVIWSNTHVSHSAEIHRAVIGRDCHIGRSTRIREGSAIGDRAHLPDYTMV